MNIITSSATAIVLLALSLVLLVSAQLGMGEGWAALSGTVLAALALVSVVAQQMTKKPVTTIGEQDDYLPPGYDEALDELSQTVSSESSLAKRESDRVGGLVSDAVETLRDSFLRLNDLSERQQTIARDVLDQAHQQKDDGYSMQDFLSESNRSLDSFVSVIVDVSRNSLDIVHRIDDMMEKLEDIFSLIENVEGISSQTNLLALNASIEAARAGEVGRGFAVVADEVRNLSKNSSALNNEIRETIQGAKQTINNLRESVGAMASNDLSDNIAVKERVTEIMSVMAKMNNSLNSHIEEMSGVGEAVSEAVQAAVRSLQFEDISAQTLSAMRGSLGSIEELGGLINQLSSQGRPASPEQLSEIAMHCRQIRENSSKRYERPTVSQQSMDEGEVELF